jgi:putative phosphonate transport system ATP-binding protein
MKPPWVLRVDGLGKRYGRGCSRCLETTGPEAATNTCARCGSIVACAGVSFDLTAGETLGIVGESGSGKTTALRCLYLDEPATWGEAYLAPFRGGEANYLRASPPERRLLRSALLGLAYQYPAQGLNLQISAGGNIAERLLAIELRKVSEIRERAAYLLGRTEVATDRMDDLPARFSGGMQQRVQLAKVLANGPAVLLLDELTTGLDVSVQAGVLDLVRELQEQTGVAMVVVSHDLGVIRLLAGRTIVMKDGRVVESGLTDQVLEDPHHPYTQLLVASMT